MTERIDINKNSDCAYAGLVPGCESVPDPVSHYYLIDFENVSYQGLYGLNLPGRGSGIRIFLSNNAHVGTTEIQEDILISKAEIDTFFCSAGTKNAMDFQIAACFGSVLDDPATERISIISKDKGFEALRDYASKVRKNVKVYQAASILEAYIAASQDADMRSYMSRKNNHVDFSSIMKTLKRKKRFEAPLRHTLASLCDEKDMETIFALAEDGELSRRDLYLKLLHIFGRTKGLYIYRILKKAFECGGHGLGQRNSS